MVNILGISAYYHDSAAAILVDGKIVGAASQGYSKKTHCVDNARRNGMECNPE